MDENTPESEDETNSTVPGLLLVEEVNESGRLPIPGKLRSVVCTDPEDGDSRTFWGYAESLNLAVLSRAWPDDMTEQLVGTFKSNGGKWVRISDDVAEATEIKQTPGELVYFVSYGDMLEEGKAYVLSARQAWKLLPVDELPDTEGIGERVLREEPGFLSSVR